MSTQPFEKGALIRLNAPVNMDAEELLDGKFFVNQRMKELMQDQTLFTCHLIDKDSYLEAWTVRVEPIDGTVSDYNYYWLADMFTKVEGKMDIHGNEVEQSAIDSGEYALLSEPSKKAGMYIKTSEAKVVENLMFIKNDESISYHRTEPRHAVITKFEFENHVDTIDEDMYDDERNVVWTPHFDTVTLDGGNYECSVVLMNDAVSTYDGDWYHEDDSGEYIFYWDSDGEWHIEPDRGDRCHTYHEGPRERAAEARNCAFSIGFEVEKEDSHPMGCYGLYECDDAWWSREEDSSLCDEIGFEFVSPVFNLYGDALEKDERIGIANPLVKDHLNADFSVRCGGHINLSHSELSTEQLFDRMTAWIPLLLAMYPGRIKRGYSTAKKSINDYKRGDRHQAVALRGGRVEFRIFSAVSSAENLLFRRDLFRIMCEHVKVNERGVTPMRVLRMLTDKRSKLHKHISKVYDSEKMLKLTSMYAQFADDFYNTYAMTEDGEGMIFKSFITTTIGRKKVPVKAIVPYVREGWSILRSTFGTEDHLASKNRFEANHAE